MQKIKKKKVIILLLIALAQILLLLLFINNQSAFANAKLSYITKAYAPSIPGIIKNYLIKESPNRGYAKSVPILTYHGVVEDKNSVNVSIDDFRKQMIALKKEGYNTVTLRDFEKFSKGEMQLPEKSFLITFDDGRKDSYYPVDPILQSLNYNAVMFVITDRSLKRVATPENFHLNLTELEKMEKSGRWEIGSHSSKGHGEIKINEEGDSGHFFSNKKWLDDQKRLETNEEFKKRITEDLSSSVTEIREKLGHHNFTFSYPFGDFGQESINYKEAPEVVSEVTESLFDITFSQWNDVVPYSFQPPNKPQNHIIKRMTVNSNTTIPDFLKRIKDGQEKKLPYSDEFKENNGWIQRSGSLYLNSNDGLTIGSLGRSNTGQTILDGSNAWRDYSLTSTVLGESNSTFTFYARYQDSKNYLSLQIDDVGSQILETKNGVKKSLKVGTFTSKEFLEKEGEITMEVNKNHIRFLNQGNVILESSQIDEELRHGGVGFETWNKTPGNSKMVITKMKATDLSNVSQKDENSVIDSFSSDTKIKEVPEVAKSENQNWWLNSGGLFLIEKGLAKTIHGSISKNSEWLKAYASKNPKDTNNGNKPQNIFRLIQKQKWRDLKQEVYFKLNNYNSIKTPNRNESNGVLLMNRYQNEDNLYYSGLRVDGNAVIKKKVNGKYITMAEKTVLEGEYDEKKNNNLIPKDQWIGLKSELKNTSKETVKLTLFLDRGNSGDWLKVLEVEDKANAFEGTAPILSYGHGGIRTDFMDAEFNDYYIRKAE